MRKLITSDVFKMARIIRISNAKEEVKEIFRQVNESEGTDAQKQNEAGIEAIAFIIDACGDSKVEEQVYGLLAGISERTEEDIKNLSFDEFVNLIKRIIEENDLKSFLSSAVKSA